MYGYVVPEMVMHHGAGRIIASCGYILLLYIRSVFAIIQLTTVASYCRFWSHFLFVFLVLKK
jgi:hypothetical protein